MPPHVAATARASGCGTPGAPARPVATSSSPARERIATPFHAASPCAATSYEREASSSFRSSAKASSASFVSCRQTTSGRRSSSHGSSRGSRCFTELTFQVARRSALPEAVLDTQRRRLRRLDLGRLGRGILGRLLDLEQLSEL